MAKNTSIILGDFYDDMIKKELETGTYATASEIIREGLRLVHERKLKITNINMALEIGEQSGKPLPYIKEELFQKITKRKTVV